MMCNSNLAFIHDQKRVGDPDDAMVKLACHKRVLDQVSPLQNPGTTQRTGRVMGPALEMPFNQT